MMDSGKHKDVKWGNAVGQIILPFYISMYDDPLEYVRKAKKVIDRKKHSLEVIVTHGIGKRVTEVFGIKVQILYLSLLFGERVSVCFLVRRAIYHINNVSFFINCVVRLDKLYRAGSHLH
jgi:malate synthase